MGHYKSRHIFLEAAGGQSAILNVWYVCCVLPRISVKDCYPALSEICLSLFVVEIQRCLKFDYLYLWFPVSQLHSSLMRGVPVWKSCLCIAYHYPVPLLFDSGAYFSIPLELWYASLLAENQPIRRKSINVNTLNLVCRDVKINPLKLMWRLTNSVKAN